MCQIIIHLLRSLSYWQRMSAGVLLQGNTWTNKVFIIYFLEENQQEWPHNKSSDKTVEEKKIWPCAEEMLWLILRRLLGEVKEKVKVVSEQSSEVVIPLGLRESKRGECVSACVCARGGSHWLVGSIICWTGRPVTPPLERLLMKRKAA